jgi:hypothetical protein
MERDVERHLHHGRPQLLGEAALIPLKFRPIQQFVGVFYQSA